MWNFQYVENLKFMKKMRFKNYESSSDVKFSVCWKLKIHEKKYVFESGRCPGPRRRAYSAPLDPQLQENPNAQKKRKKLMNANSFHLFR